MRLESVMVPLEVRPVREPSVPVMVEFPVTAMPPEETVRVAGVVMAPVEVMVVVAVPPKYAVPTFERSVEDALANDWSAVHEFAFPVLRETVRAVEPLYEPENVSEEFPAVRSARVPPSAMPEMVELVRPALFKVPVTEFGANVKVPPELVIAFENERPLKVVAEDVASVIAPVWPEPYVCAMLVTPLLIEEVATHVGTPPESASTYPLVPGEVVASALVPLP